MAHCASCKARVEEGAVHCFSCGAELARPGAFMQVFGWVVFAISTIPFAISLVTTGEGNYIPLGLGCVIAVTGLGMILGGRMKTNAAPPATLPQERGFPGTMPQG
jgi:hypothetical protein